MASPSLSPEATVARTALRVAVGEERDARLQAQIDMLGDAVRPDRLADWCRFHGITPSVHRALASLPESVVRDRLLGALAASRREAAGAGLVQADALARILKRFAQEGVDVIPLKGISLAVRDYGGVGRRKDGDHDLLVRPEQVGRAGRILADLGYRSPNAPQPVETWTDATTRANVEGETPFHAPTMIRTGGPMPSVVELHWALSEPREHAGTGAHRRLVKRAWERSETDNLLGASVRCLSTEDEILYLCLHVVRHLTKVGSDFAVRLAMMEDLARRVQSAEVSWTVVSDRVAAAGLRYRILGPVRFLWTEGIGAEAGTLLPDAAVAVSSWPSWLGRLVMPSVAHILSDDRPVLSAPQTVGHREKMRELAMRLVLLRSWADRLRVLRRAASVPEHEREVTPSSVPDALLVPARLIRLTIRLVQEREGDG